MKINLKELGRNCVNKLRWTQNKIKCGNTLNTLSFGPHKRWSILGQMGDFPVLKKKLRENLLRQGV